MSLLVFGDFNLPHKTQAYIDFMQDARLQDAFEGNYRPTYHATFLPKGRIPYQVDHVLVWSDRQLPKFLKRSQYILTNPSRHDNRNIYASDHVGLAVDIDSTA
jgi:endonuclease/exonuclease/phosphatase family metal-dependent hydrolase